MRVEDKMIIVIAGSEDEKYEEIAFPEKQLNWFKNKLGI